MNTTIDSNKLVSSAWISSLEDYVAFVREWRAVYKQLTHAIRYYKLASVNLQKPHKIAKLEQLKAQNPTEWHPVIKEILQKSTFGGKLYPSYALSHLRCFATQMLLARAEGKVWVKKNHPWPAKS